MLDKAMAEIHMELYGPKWCGHCQAVQPVRTFILQGSERVKSSDDYKITASFIGSRACSVCFRTISDAPTHPAELEGGDK